MLYEFVQQERNKNKNDNLQVIYVVTGLLKLGTEKIKVKTLTVSSRFH